MKRSQGPTRMLRAVRLEQRLGFTIESRTLELMHQAMPLLGRVSGERLRDELGLTFAEPTAGAAMTRLHALGLLAAVHPALAWNQRLSTRLDELRTFRPPAEWRLREAPEAERLLYAVWLSELDANQVAEVCARMRFSLVTRAVVIDAQRLAAALPRWPAGVSPSEVAARLDETREESLVAAWLALLPTAEWSPTRSLTRTPRPAGPSSACGKVRTWWASHQRPGWTGSAANLRAVQPRH